MTALEERKRERQEERTSVVEPSRRRRLSKRTFLTCGTLIAVVAAVLVGLLMASGSTASVVATHPSSGTVSANATGTGSLGAINEVTVPVSLPGLTTALAITAINVVVGSDVKVGDVIATLDGTVIADYVSRIKARLTADQVALSVSTVPVQRALLQGTVGLDESDLARAERYSSQVLAPMDGQVSLVRESVGTLVTSGRPIMNLVSLDALRATIAVPTTDINKVLVGQSVSLSFPQLPDVKGEALVQTISPGSSNAGLNVSVTVKLVNPDPRLRLGMQAYAGFSHPIQASLTLPLIAVHNPDGAAFVLAVDSSGHARIRPVVLQAHDLERAAILSGVTRDDMVILTDAQKVSDGDKVSVDKVQDR